MPLCNPAPYRPTAPKQTTDLLSLSIAKGLVYIFLGQQNICTIFVWLSLSIVILIFMLLHALAVHSFLFWGVFSYMNIPHLCIHSPGGYLGCLQCWDITNKAAVSIYEQLFLWMWTFTSLGQGPKISMTSSYGNFKETSKLFSTMVGPFYIPTSSLWEFQFSHTLANT